MAPQMHVPLILFPSLQAFTVTDRPALDSLDNALDRVKMSIYQTCADWGIPCPVTGQPPDHHTEKYA